MLAKDFEKYGAPADEKFKGITVEQLLTHRAGIDKNTFGNAITTGDAFKQTIQTPLKSDPGAQFFYSDSAYLVLGIVAERVSGTPYTGTCAKPLTETGGAGAIEPTLAERAPNGGWKISAIDYVKFLRFFDTGSNLLKAPTKTWLRAPGGGYSLGAFLKRSSSGVVLSHTGLVHHDRTHPLTGGSYYIVDLRGYSVVVIFSGENKDPVYAALTATVDKALASDSAGAQ